jgi:uncharacterized membrane protein YoaK (UPF0700 family)
MSDSSVRNALLVALTFVAGAVDATSYLGLGRVFTANMTGNMILLGLGAGRIQGLDVLRSGTAFLGFAIGAAIGARILGRTASPEIWHRRVTVALGIETVLLGAFAVGWLWMSAEPQRPWLEALIAFSAGAMGIQSAAAQRLAVASVSTTFVTGTLTSVITQLALFGHPTTGWPLRAGVVLALTLGAGADAVVLLHAPVLAPLVPLLALAAVAGTAARRFWSAK